MTNSSQKWVWALEEQVALIPALEEQVETTSGLEEKATIPALRGLLEEVEEAGLMDGLSCLKVIWKITLPLALPRNSAAMLADNVSRIDRSVHSSRLVARNLPLGCCHDQ